MKNVLMIRTMVNQRASFVTVFLLAIALAHSHHAFALERFVVNSWSHKDGLPSTLIYAITQTRDGYLWLGTSDGLVRYDGFAFDHQKLIVNSELMLGRVTALLGTKDGALWVGSASGLLTEMNGPRLRKYRLGADIEAIAEPSPREIWVIASSGLYRFASEAQGELTPVESIGAEQIGQVLGTGASNLMLGTRRDGLTIAKEVQEPVAVRGRKVELSGRPFSMKEGQNGDTWLSKASFPDTSTYSVFLHDKRGYLWSGSRESGLIRTTPEGTASTPELASHLVECLFEDREGNVWIGTNNGLYQFRYGKVFSVTAREGLTNDRVSSVAANGAVVWIGTQSGLDRLDQLHVRQCVRGTNVMTVKPLRNREVWIGTNQGLFRVSDSGRVLRSEPIIRDLSSVIAIEEDGAGSVWLLDAEKGLHRWHDGVLAAIRSDARLKGGNISFIRAQSDGTVWIGFSGGQVRVYRNDRFRESPEIPDAARGTVYDVYADGPGVVWVASDTGLYRFSRKEKAVWDARDGLPGNRVLWMQPNGTDWFWLGFSTGIAHVRRSNLLKSDSGSPTHVRCDFYDFEDGLMGNPVRQSQAAATQDSEGKLWLTTSAGIAMIDSRHIEKNSLPPPVLIERVIADNREVATGSAIRFPPLTKNLEIDYAALSLAEPRKIQFRYELEGYDKQWQDAGNRRQAFYTNLQPGAYRFRVLAANNDGVWNERGASIDFSVQPAFQQTETFKFLCFAAIGIAALGIYRLRMQQLRASWNAKLETRLAERTRIAQDLHDDLLQSAMGVSLQIELVDSLVEEPTVAKLHLQRALTLSRALMQKGREVLRDLREKTRDGRDIANSLSLMIQDLQQEGGPAVRLNVEGKPRPVNPLVADDLAQIGRQAITNAFQHADAKAIEVQLHYRVTELRLQVSDDGRGMSQSTAQSGRPGHYGLVGMRERAERIGGTLTIASVAGQGTKLTASVPGRQAYSTRKKHD